MADNKKLTKQDLTGSNKTSRRKWLLTALAAAAIAAGGAWYGGVFAPDAAPAYRTADITRGNLMVTVTANGTVNPCRLPWRCVEARSRGDLGGRNSGSDNTNMRVSTDSMRSGG